MSGHPQWLERLANLACETLHTIEDAPPIGCHFFQDGETWEVSLFLSQLEVVGGEQDGQRVRSLFVVDVAQLIQLFDAVESVSWQPHPLDEQDDIRAHLGVTGTYQGHSVWLRVLADSPDQFSPGRYINVHTNNIISTWN